MLLIQNSYQTIFSGTDVKCNKYELLKISLDFIGTIIWPVIVLIIILIYKKALLKLLENTKKVELPGGISLETINQEINDATFLATEVKTERLPQEQKIINNFKLKDENEVNTKMVARGLTPSPSGLDLSYYRNIADYDPRLALAGLRIDLELMLRNLAKGFNLKLTKTDSIFNILSELRENKAITSTQYELINATFKILNSGVHGSDISQEQVQRVLRIGQVLVDDYLLWLDWGFNHKN